ncbi:caspase b-like [Puntigrus tetrazona]|uniref:caspase b-like n=1 Tax=Puntigrus tetrazona TaxID=1606681 RepID=UPI001C895FB1|nr:caspase b-like [Puntigrus tetrazona]
MAAVIFDVLSELLDAEFKEFKWRLSDHGTLDSSSIARGKLEHANRHEVVDLIVQQYTGSDAGRIAIRALRQIKQNELADQLKAKLQEVSEEGSAEDGASSGAAAANTSRTGVTMNIQASDGGNVNAPVLQNGVYHGSVTFN